MQAIIEDIDHRKRERCEAARRDGWEAGYARVPYPYTKRVADIEFAKGYAEGLVADISDMAEVVGATP